MQTRLALGQTTLSHGELAAEIVRPFGCQVEVAVTGGRRRR